MWHVRRGPRAGVSPERLVSLYYTFHGLMSCRCFLIILTEVHLTVVANLASAVQVPSSVATSARATARATRSRRHHQGATVVMFSKGVSPNQKRESCFDVIPLQELTTLLVIGYYEGWNARSKCHETKPDDLPGKDP